MGVSHWGRFGKENMAKWTRWSTTLSYYHEWKFCLGKSSLRDDTLGSNMTMRRVIVPNSPKISWRSWNSHHSLAPLLTWPQFDRARLGLDEKDINNVFLRSGYDPQRISLYNLRQIVDEAWNAVPDDFIIKLYESWWDRCDAVICTGRGPIWY